MNVRLTILICSLNCAYCFGQIKEPQTPQSGSAQPVYGNTPNTSPYTPQYQQPGTPVQMGATASTVMNNGRSSSTSNNQRQKELEQLRRDVEESKRYSQPQIPAEEKPYYDAFNSLNSMAGAKNFSLTDAIYTVENAYFNNKLPKEDFKKSLQVRAELCKQILKREHLTDNNNLALNYAIQKLFQQSNTYYDSKLKKNITIPQIKYDFDDWHGDSSYTKLMVTKLIATSSGQCHSMPLLYLLIADQLGAKAYLSTSPDHSFIRFTDTAGHLYNFETTSGVLVNDNFMTASSYINTAAIKSKIYLDTLTAKQLLALCYIDLANEHVSKFDYSPFAEQLAQKAVELYPNCIQAHMMLAIIDQRKLEYYGMKQGCKRLEDVTKYPQLAPYNNALQKQYDIIDGLGYQPMPKEAYMAWLNSVKEQKRKQETSQMEQQLKYQLQFSKVKTISTKQ